MSINLVLNNLEEDVVRALIARAVANGRSTEEEHLAILREVLQGPARRPLAEVLASMPNVGEDDDFERSA